MEQTAVEWLIENSHIIPKNELNKRELIQQAKEMEKEQMWEYIKSNYVNGENSLSFHKKEFEQYYNETFKSE